MKRFLTLLSLLTAVLLLAACAPAQSEQPAAAPAGDSFPTVLVYSSPL